jgi:ubiquinone/menaquinone biosynthesis C-methylase UbiE
MNATTAHPPPHLAAALAANESVNAIEPGIWQPSSAEGVGAAQYDSIGSAYDLVGGLGLYHRAFWGVSTRAYRAFAERAVTACGEGTTMLDAGCGSMLFSAEAYRADPRVAVIGIDASLRMLRLARARLDSTRVALLQADVLQSPFRAGAFEVVTCLHVAHVLQDLPGLLGELRRILEPGGRLFLTSVVLVNHWRDRYLRALARRGVMASPRRQEDILRGVRASFGTEADSHLVGNMLFLEVTNQPGRSVPVGPAE